MIKALMIDVYHLFYWLLSFVVKGKKYDVVIIAKHNNNVINYLEMHPDETVGAITSNRAFREYLKTYPLTKKVIRYESYNPFSVFAQIVLILQTDKIVIDDYYPPLFVIDKTKEIWNIWHSYAVYKKIGLVSPLYSEKGKGTLKRYQRNYQRIDKLFVRSDIEHHIFMESYQIAPEQIIIDKRLYRSQYADLPYKKKKEKIIVYAPTFRSYAYDFFKVYEKIKAQFVDYKVLVSFHQITLRDYPKFRKLHNPLPLPRLLEDATIFMTDYSSLLIEIAELCQDKGITVYQVFDDGDYVKYTQTSGLNEGVYRRAYDALHINQKENKGHS